MALIHEQLIKVMQGVTGVAKRDRNYQQKFLFRGIDAVLNAVGPVLREHEVFIAPMVENIEYQTVADSKARQTAHVLVHVQYTFFAADGSNVAVEVVGEAMDYGDKAVSKAMSVALRIALLQTLALPTDEKDPDADSYERSTTHPAAPATPANPTTPTPAPLPAPTALPATPRSDEPSQAAPTPTSHPPATPPAPTSHPTTSQPEPIDQAEQTRQAILDWGQQNNVTPIELARRFGAEMDADIRTASVEALNNFYAMLSLGGEKVE